MQQNLSYDDQFVDRRATYSKKITDLPKRPERSKKLNDIGSVISLCTNHYQIDLEAMFKTVYIYGMNISYANSQDSESYEEFPRDNRKGRSQIFKSVEGKFKELFGKFYQSGLNIWAFKKISQDQSTILTSLLQKKIILKIETPTAYSYNELINNDDLSQAFRQVLNVITKTYLKELGYIENGKDLKYFKISERDKNVVKSNDMLKVWHGYKTSVHVIEKNPMLLIDFSVRVLRQETALKRIEEYQKQGWTNKEIDLEMQENSVMSNYTNQQIYRVTSVDFNRNPMSKFKLDDSRETTFVDYFKEKYNLVIRNKTQPLIVHLKKLWENVIVNGKQSKKRIIQEICLIPELVNMTGIRDEEKANRNLMKDLAEYTKLEPARRMKVISNLRDPLISKFKNDGYILKNLTNFKGTLMYPPKIFLGNNKNLVPLDGNFQIRQPIYQPTEIKDWIMIYNKRGNNDDADVDDFIEMLIKSAGTFGIKIQKPFFLNVKSLKYKDWEEEIDKELKHGDVSMILTWIPENQKGVLYKPLKKLCYEYEGIPHQNVLSNKYLNSKNKMSHASKIALQMNAKLGKLLWYVEPVKGIPKKTMIIGVDVYHKTIKNKQSCAGFVATLDEKFSTYYCSTVIQAVGEELMKGIAGQVHEAIKEYLKVNKSLPELIILYRDGVGESQIIDVFNIEVEAIKALFPSIDAKYKPQFLEIIINKRINQRFFSEGSNGEIYNPKSGTLVCDTVTHDYFEFFIVPQNVTQGTATPSSFRVIENSTTLSQETIYQITFFQCHNYANWTGAVRVPASTMYAHKLAYLVGETFQNDIHQRLRRTLCFL